MNSSEIIIGTMRWGSWGANFSTSEAQKFIERSLENNFYSFDLADIYGDYTTEKLFGEAFSSSKIPREKVQLITKYGIKIPNKNSNGNIKSYDYSMDYILRQVDKSLQNLQTDYIDILLLHRPSPLMNPEEIASAFGILRSSGKVLDFGVSNFSVSQFELISKYFPFLVTNQIEISVNTTDAFFDGTLDQMMQKKLKPMAYSVLENYFSAPENPQNIRLKSVLKELSEKYSAEESQLLIAFLRKHPSGILPIIGTTKSENLKKFRTALDINLEDEDWFRILEASEGKEVP